MEESKNDPSTISIAALVGEDSAATNFGMASRAEASVYVQKIVQAQIASLESQLAIVQHNPNEAAGLHECDLANESMLLTDDEQVQLLARQREALEQVKSLQRENEQLKKQIFAQQELNLELERNKNQIASRFLDLQPQETEADLQSELLPQQEEQPLTASLLEEAIVPEWQGWQDNKIQIKYYDAQQNSGEANPFQFYLDITKKKEENGQIGLQYNRLSLVESSFTPSQWNHLSMLVTRKFNSILRRVRVWDTGLSAVIPQKALSAIESADHLDICLANLFLAAFKNREGVVELDLQYLQLGPKSINVLSQLLKEVKMLKRLTLIAERTNSASMSTLLESLNSNQSLQLDSLVLYGLDLSSCEAGRSLAHLMGRQRKIKVVRVQECNLLGKSLFAILTSLRKSQAIHSLEKLFLSLNHLDTQESVVTLCGLVKEATQLRLLCTFYTGVIVKWPGNEAGCNEIVAISEKKNEELCRLLL